MTNDYIRSLCGLSEAELSDEQLDNSKVVIKAELARQQYFTTLVELDDANPTQEAIDQLDYMAYKAILLLKSAILVSIPKTVKDNFNSFTRFNSIEQLFDFAEALVLKIEKPLDEDYNLLTVVTPDFDPVTQG